MEGWKYAERNSSETRADSRWRLHTQKYDRTRILAIEKAQSLNIRFTSPNNNQCGYAVEPRDELPAVDDQEQGRMGGWKD